MVNNNHTIFVEKRWYMVNREFSSASMPRAACHHFGVDDPYSHCRSLVFVGQGHPLENTDRFEPVC